MNIECEDKIELLDEELETMSKKTLERILAIIKDCKECEGCNSDIKILQNMIKEMK